VAVDAGERRHATVMFSDLTGYTALNEATDPERSKAIMGRIKDEATAVIERHGGTVNQFVGDEIMALFGVPLARRDDPRRAVAAALELHAAVDRLDRPNWARRPAGRASACTPASTPASSSPGAATPAPAPMP
jgi:class 3 adenylate cyclase